MKTGLTYSTNLVICSLLILMSSQVSGFTFTLSEDEFNTWTERCQALFLSTNAGQRSPFFSALPRELISYYRKMGNENGGPWHYCKSKIVLQRAKIAIDPVKKQRFYEEAQREATYTYVRMPKENPWIAEIAVTLGQIHEGLKDDVKAMSYYYDAIRLHPQNTNSYAALSLLLRKSGDIKEAISVLHTGVGNAKEEPAELYYLLGFLYIESGQNDKAIEYGKKAYELGYPLQGLKARLQKIQTKD